MFLTKKIRYYRQKVKHWFELISQDKSYLFEFLLILLLALLVIFGIGWM